MHFHQNSNIIFLLFFLPVFFVLGLLSVRIMKSEQKTAFYSPMLGYIASSHEGMQSRFILSTGTVGREKIFKKHQLYMFILPLALSSGNKSSSAACGRYSEMIYCAAVCVQRRRSRQAAHRAPQAGPSLKYQPPHFVEAVFFSLLCSQI